VAVHNARVLDQAQRECSRLTAAITSRSTIDRAVGIIMSRSGITEGEAFIRLRTTSQHQHIKLALVAARLVDEAVRRAQAHCATAER
jgi:AmiR/NasT family two-component response regulator